MADPTNPNDPAYKDNPNYVFSGGRWQYREANYNDEAAKARAAAQPTKVTGQTVWTDPFKGLIPSGADKLAAAGLRSDDTFARYNELMPMLREGAIRGQAANPYNAGIADQSRAAQLALLAQMRGQAAGPSLAAMQGTQAMGQGLQAALRGGGGRAGMVGLGQQGAGMAADVARARLAEQMRAQAGMGGLAGGLRGADLRSAQEQVGAGLRAQDLADARARFYAQQGDLLARARAAQAVDLNSIARQIDINNIGAGVGVAKNSAGALAAGLSSMFK